LLKEFVVSGPKSPEINLDDDQRQQLLTLVGAHKTSQQIVFRAKIILLLSQGLNTTEVAARLQTTRVTVRLWRQHWIERQHCPVRERLQDAQRAGAPPTFTAEQWCQIMALACQPPQLSDRPITHWTPRELADEAQKRRIVESISERHLGRFLKSGRFKTASESLLAKRFA